MKTDYSDVIRKGVEKSMPHQTKTLAQLHAHDQIPDPVANGHIIAASMGMGKTYTAITYSIQRRLSGQNRDHVPALVVCGKSVAPNWVAELNKFYPGIPVLYYHRDVMHKAFDTIDRDDFSRYWFVVTTYDVVKHAAKKLDLLKTTESEERFGGFTKKFIDRPRFVPKSDAVGPRLLFSTHFYEVIADESQTMANPTAQVFKGMMLIHSRKYLCLSGTPIRNGALDIFSQYRWMGFEKIRHPKEWKVESVQQHGLDKYNIRITYADSGVPLPDMHRKTVPIKFHSQHESIIFAYYLQKSRQLMSYYNEHRDNESVGALLGCFQRMLQACMAPYLITPESKRNPEKAIKETNILQDLEDLNARRDGLIQWMQDIKGDAGFGSAKMRAFEEVFRKIPMSEKVLVFSSFTSALDLAKKTLEHYHPDVDTLIIDGSHSLIQREQILTTFRTEPSYQVLFIGYKTGSEGLNVQSANHVIFLEPWWCPAVQDQAIARAHRMGQTKDVHVYDLVVENSLDSRIMETIERKRAIIAEILDGSTSITKGAKGLTIDLMRKLICN